MSEAVAAVPPRLQEIVEEFKLCEGQEKLELLLEYAEKLPPLPDWLDKNNDMDQVHECMTPVFVQAELKNGEILFYFDVPPQSPTVRGYAAILSEGLRGATPEQVLNLPHSFYYEMGLQQVITGQRLRGMDGILAHLKRLARGYN